MKYLKTILVLGVLVSGIGFQAPANAMNKQNLVDAMAAKARISKAQATNALNEFMNATAAALKKGDKVILTGFGTFSLRNRAARTGRNPQTGTTINIPAKKIVQFKAGSKLNNSIE